MRIISVISGAFLLVSVVLGQGGATGQSWDDVVAKARNGEVYWHAWGGSPAINDYIAWVADRVADDYDITLNHVKIADTANVVKAIAAEKDAGRTQGGLIDLMWINGENFHRLKREELLLGPIQDLPALQFVDTDRFAYDFAVATDGLEVPWGQARLIFIHDSANTQAPPKSIADFLPYAKQHPGRITYPPPPEFIGTTVLKQILLSLHEDITVFQKPPGDDADTHLAVLWEFLDDLHPLMWREGEAFPENENNMRYLLDNGEIDIAMSFNVGAVSTAIDRGLLPATARSYVLEEGTLGNAHYLAIPFNAANEHAAKVVINFLLSPEAQAHKQHPLNWGDPSVLDFNLMDKAGQKAFAAIPDDPAVLTLADLGPSFAEPHVEWVELIEERWLQRYQK
ncbi:MAG: ABC transporter substrate-binding protein [Pseudomonadota bacterium]